MKRALVISVSLPVFLFCCASYFATFEVEPTPRAWVWGLIYWVLGTLSLYLTARSLKPGRKLKATV